jgi:hypothetical protein
MWSLITAVQVKLGGSSRGVLDFQAPGGHDTSWLQVGEGAAQLLALHATGAAAQINLILS